MDHEKPKKLMVVDDDARIRDLLRRYLSQEGYEVFVAEDSKAMSRIMVKERFDLIVTMLRQQHHVAALLARQRGQCPITRLASDFFHTLPRRHFQLQSGLGIGHTEVVADLGAMSGERPGCSLQTVIDVQGTKPFAPPEIAGCQQQGRGIGPAAEGDADALGLGEAGVLRRETPQRGQRGVVRQRRRGL